MKGLWGKPEKTVYYTSKGFFMTFQCPKVDMTIFASSTKIGRKMV